MVVAEIEGKVMLKSLNLREAFFIAEAVAQRINPALKLKLMLSGNSASPKSEAQQTKLTK